MQWWCPVRRRENGQPCENVGQICAGIHPICETPCETTSGWEGLSSFLLALSPFSVFLCDFDIFPHFRRVTLGRAVRVVERWHSSFSWLCLFLTTPIWRSSYPAGIASARQQKNLLPVHPQMSAIEVLYNHKLRDLSSITLLPSAAGFGS